MGACRWGSTRASAMVVVVVLEVVVTYSVVDVAGSGIGLSDPLKLRAAIMPMIRMARKQRAIMLPPRPLGVSGGRWIGMNGGWFVRSGS